MFFTFPEDVRCTPSKRRAPQRRRDLALALIVARLLEDLKPGVVLEGVVTNVAAFGAFVDVGGSPGRVGAHLGDGQCFRQRSAQGLRSLAMWSVSKSWKSTRYVGGSR
jgi:hypothetical protein